MADQTPESPWAAGLCFYWDEIRQEEEAGARWGQLAGGMHRLFDIREDLEAVTRDRNIERCLHKLVLYIEAFFARAYELRERAIALLAGRTGMPKEAKALKKLTKRPSAATDLIQAQPRLTKTVVALLESMDEDALLRNRHTHEQYLSLGLATGHDVFDPSDALVDVENRPRARHRLVAHLRREAKKLAKEYGKKITELVRLTEAVLEAGDDHKRPPR